MSAEQWKRVLAGVLALLFIFLGVEAGHYLGDAYLDSGECVEQNRDVVSGVGFFGVLLSILMAFRDGLGAIGEFFRYLIGRKNDFSWSKEGFAIGVGAFALIVLSSFSTLTLVEECPVPPEPPKCQTTFEACGTLSLGAECDACNAHQSIHRTVRKIDQELDSLKLERVGAFPLLFSNARTNGGQLTAESPGIQLADGQFERWRHDLFGSATWPLDTVDGLVYCVVGYSSLASFEGKTREQSNVLNCKAANLRAANVAAALAEAVKSKPVGTPRVASCRWRSYEAMVRPHLHPDAHLSEGDRHLVSRSVFVRAFRKAQAPSTSDAKSGAPMSCPEWVASESNAQPEDLECLEV